MKKALSGSLLALLLLSSCSLFQRNPEDLEAEGNMPPFEPTQSAMESEGSPAVAPSSLEGEISRLNTKVSALETKLDVLTANLERMQLQRSQPVLEARPMPQASMAVPVEEEEAPIVTRAASLPAATKIAASSSGSEGEFRLAMESFQAGNNQEAATRFSLFAKKHPQHLLASHALYWAGEANARAGEWSVAQENWEVLEKLYPRSAYLPDALAGLARAHDSLGDAGKARAYRDTLARAFPRAPATLALRSNSTPSDRPATRAAAPAQNQDIDIPAYEEDGSASSGAQGE